MNIDTSKLAGQRVVVTGSAGFIGCHLCESLLEHGACVTAVDDLSAGKEHNYAPYRNHPHFHHKTVDITDPSALRPLFENGIDIIFHNAASKKTVCLRDPARDLDVNAGGTLNLLLMSVEFGVKKFVHASTGSVYGEPVIFPTNEEHPLNPRSYYGVSNLAGERYVATFNQLHGLDTTILRYFHVYGPRQESNEFGGVVSIFLRNALEKKNLTVHGDGTQMRSFTWVKDLVNANLLAAIDPRASGEVYNCASGIQVSVGELAEGILRLMGSRTTSTIVHSDWAVGDIKYFDVDNRKIREQLGMVFDTDFWGRMSDTVDEFIGYLEAYEIQPSAASV
ncbi:MAG: NAD-dependent epimerase/dehydratase family protein [Vulcanimicrobiota bacterium]